MKTLGIILSILGIMSMPASNTIYDYSAKDIDGNNVNLSDYKGKVLLIVNTASECGFTPQYEQLEMIYKRYNQFGFEILGFPCNQFGGQEPGSEEDIKEFCQKNYGVSFPMFSKIDVKGENQHPIYEFLTQKSKNGKLDSEVKWNFQKYLIDKDGKLVEMFKSNVDPVDADFLEKVNRLLFEKEEE